MKEKMNQLEELLCQGKSVYVGRGLRGVIFTTKDYQQLLTVFEELQRSLKDEAY